MINIMLNGEKRTFDAAVTLDHVLSDGQHAPPFAVALNKHFVPKTEYVHVLLQEGDEVDIVTPMQGG